MTTARLMSAWFAAALLSPPLAFAEANGTDPEDRREGFSVGVLITLQAFGGRIVSVRVSTPAGRKAGFDFDVGYRLGRTPKPHKLTSKGFAWAADGWVAAAHVRWLPKGRGDTGWSGYLLGGVRVMQGTATQASGGTRRLLFQGIDVGFGFDRVVARGYRAGAEAANSVPWSGRAKGEYPSDMMAPFVNGFALWRR